MSGPEALPNARRGEGRAMVLAIALLHVASDAINSVAERLVEIEGVFSVGQG